MTIIPQALLALARWVLYIILNGAKIPFDPNSLLPANSPGACASYQRAVACLANAPGFHGLGFRFDYDETAPFAFVDLDHCRNPETDEIEPWALDIVARLNSYSEISPSGTGLHIYMRRGNIEIYTRSRWATVTGDHLAGTPVDLEDRTEELLTLHREVFGSSDPGSAMPPASTTPSPLSDQELIGLASTAANGARFRQLYYGPVPAGDRSRLDFELVCKLMFWAGQDFERIDRLFRASVLMREKWFRADYRLRTMRAAAARCTERYTPSKEVV